MGMIHIGRIRSGFDLLPVAGLDPFEFSSLCLVKQKRLVITFLSPDIGTADMAFGDTKSSAMYKTGHFTGVSEIRTVRMRNDSRKARQ